MEFHAIILCGGGHRLAPFSSFSSNGGVSKALLPVANQPLISHVLDWCERTKFKKITIVTTSSTVQEIKRYVEDLPGGGMSNCEIIGSESAYTGEIIYNLRDSISGDFVVLPCDFITDIEPSALMNAFRSRDPDVLASVVVYKHNLEHVDKKDIQSNVLVHTPLKKHQPKFLDSFHRDAIKSNKYIELRLSMLWRYANSIVSTNLLTSGITICSHKILELLSNDKERGNLVSPLQKPWTKVIRDLARRSWSHRTGFETLGLYLIPDANHFMRANSLSVYLEANRHILKEQAKKLGGVKPSSVPKGTATISADSLVGVETVIGERTTVKKSSIGQNCTIGKRCRITGCVIFDGVNIADDTYLENCLIGKFAKIGTKSRLTSCNVEGKYNVSDNIQLKNETLQSLTFGDGSYGFATESESSEDEDDDGATSDGSRWGADEYDENDDDDEFNDDDDFFER